MRVSDRSYGRGGLDDSGEPTKIDRHRLIRQFCCDAEPAKYLDRERPSLENAALFTEDRPVLTRYCERLARLRRDGQRSRSNGEFRKRPQRCNAPTGPAAGTNQQDQSSQNVMCAPNCILRMGLPMSWIIPAALESTAVTGKARLVRLIALKTSHRNSR